MDSNNGYIKLETPIDKIKNQFKRLREKVFAQQELKARIKKELAELELRKTAK